MVNQGWEKQVRNAARPDKLFRVTHFRPFLGLSGLLILGMMLSQTASSSSVLPPDHSPWQRDCAACHSAPDEANETLIDGLVSPQASGTGIVEGYASASSVPQGGSIDFHISTDVTAYDVQIFREGANGRELMRTITDLPGAYYGCTANEYGAPIGVPAGYESEDLGCDWPVAYTLDVPADWPSGIYVADLLDEDDVPGGYGSYIFFIVTEDQPGSTSDILFQSSTNTWQAYNNYGDWGLYTNPPARRVTFDRPYVACTGCQYKWEIPLVRWLESEGYAVEYAANEDLHVDPTLIFSYRLFLSTGHDEYWSKEIRDNIDAFIDAGGNVAIFSGNTGYRQVRYQEGMRTLVCYKKDRTLDPLYGVDNIRVATEFAAYPVLWPENSTTGLGWRNGGFVNQPSYPYTGRYTVYHSAHWVYAGTGLQDGDEFWYEPEARVEVDGALFVWEDGVPVVTGEDETPLNFIILGLEPATQGHATMGIYSRYGGGTVFNAATMGWGRGLWPATNPDGYEIVRQITRNVLNALTSGDPPPPPTYPVEQVALSYQPADPLKGEVVTFSATITPTYATPPITFAWQFGDETPVSSTHASIVTHTYETAGSFTASITATNPYGQSSDDQTVVVAETYPVEQVALSYQPADPLKGEVMTFTATITPTYATPPITFAWQFGDQTPVSTTHSSIVTHAYETAGSFMASVTAANSYGQSSDDQAVTVAETYPVEQVALSYRPAAPLKGEIVTFTAAITPAYATPPITFAWQFGDETPVSTTHSSIVTHTYAMTGSFTAFVTAANAYGQNTCSETITVALLPEPDRKWYSFLPLVIR